MYLLQYLVSFGQTWFNFNHVCIFNKDLDKILLL